MKTRFIIDVATGVITRRNAGASVPDAQVGFITARDILDCEVQLMAGDSDVTEDILDGRQLRLGLRKYPSDGAILAQSEPHTMSGGVANCVLDLNTAEIVALIAPLPAAARSTTAWFEAEVSAEDGSYRQTLAQQQFTLFCEVNMEGDEPPARAADSAASASESAADAEQAKSDAEAAAAAAAASATAAQGVGTLTWLTLGGRTSAAQARTDLGAQASNTTLTRVAAGDISRSLLEFGGTSVDSGDGTANVTAFTAALAAMPNGGRIILPAGGTFRLASSIALISNIVIEGFGATVKVLGDFAAFSTNGTVGVRIVGVKFVGRSQNYAGTFLDTGIEASGSTLLRVHDCEFSGLTHGIYGQLTNRFVSKDCSFRTISGTAIRLPDARYAAIHNPNIDGLRTGIGDGYATRVGVWLPEGDYAGNDNEIKGGVVMNCFNECVNVRAARTIIEGTNISMPWAGSAAFYSNHGSGGLVVEGTSNNYTPGTPRAGSFLTITNVQIEGTFLSLRIDPANPGASPIDILLADIQISNIGFATQAFQISGESATNQMANVRASDIKIRNVAVSGSTSIYLANVKNVTLDGFDVDGADVAISLQGLAANATANIVIRNGNVANANRVWDGYGTAAAAISNVVVENIASTTGTGTCTSAYRVDSAVSGMLVNGTFRNLVHRGSATTGFSLSGSALSVDRVFAPDALTEVAFTGTYSFATVPMSSGIRAFAGEDISFNGATSKDLLFNLLGSGSSKFSGGNGGAKGTVDILSGSNDAAIRLGNVSTDAVTKDTKVTFRARTNSQPDVMAFELTASSGNNTISQGGGSSAQQAVTIHDWYVASSVNTATGTRMMRLSSAGLNIGAAGAGTAIDWIGSATASLDFPSIAAGAYADLTITVTGASVNDAVIQGPPSAPPAGIDFTMFVSATNTVTVRAKNTTGGAIDPAAATFRATVVSH